VESRISAAERWAHRCEATHLDRADERLTDQVLLNPELAAELLKENNPANRAALNRKAKAWLGNEAATLTQILDGEDEPAPIEDDGPFISAVMKGAK
jgi:hypothetical protein